MTSNAYLEQRRSKLIANDTLMRSLGLLPPMNSVSAAADKAEASARAVEARNAMVVDTEGATLDERPSENARSKRRSHPTPSTGASTGVGQATTESPAPLRRSTRQVLPRQKKFMEEDFDKEKRMKMARGFSKKVNGSVRLGPFPYVPDSNDERKSTTSGAEDRTEEASYENSALPLVLEKSMTASVVWDAYEPPGARVRRYSTDEEEEEEDVVPITTESSLSDTEEESSPAVALAPAPVIKEKSSSPKPPFKRFSIMYKPHIESQPSPPPKKKAPATPKQSPPKVRFYLDLPHERDFYATLISSCSKENQHMYDVSDSLSTAIPAHSTSEKVCSGVLKWIIPEWLPLGTYYLQMGSRRKRVFCSTDEFTLTETVGRYDETNVGVWCVCGNTDARQEYTGSWVSCTNCAAWQHWSCYTRISESRHMRTGAATVLERVIVNDEEEDSGANDGKGTGETPVPAKRRRLSKKERQEVTEALAARVSHVHLLVPDVLPNPDEDFLCWACQPLSHLARDTKGADEKERKSHFQALGERCELMINMIGAASGGYSRKLLPGAEDSSQTVLCNTPLHVVRFLKTLIDAEREKVCVDLGAGTGSFSGALPPSSLCVEINERRCAKGKTLRPELEWLNMDALSPEFFRDRFGTFDLVISNPDFEVGLQFLFLGLCLIRNACLSNRGESLTPDDSRSGRLIFLLPSDYFEASNLRARIFKLLDFHIETEYKLGHLCYYEDQPQSQKLTCDSLFVLRPGRGGQRKYEHRVVNARLAGML